MNNLLDYKELKKLATDKSYTIAERYEFIEKILDANSVIKSYGKNMFDLKPSEVEMYFITNDKIIDVKMEPFVLKTYNIRDIQNIEIEKKSRYEIILRIYAGDKSIIEFNNKLDSDEDWQNDYIVFISDIANYLINLKSS